MLHILLFFLKILLFILLGALAIVLLGVLIILFAPITYKVDARYEKKADVIAVIRFLMISLHVRYNQDEKELKQNIRIFGIRLGKKKTEEVERKLSDTEMKEQNILEIDDTFEDNAEAVEDDFEDVTEFVEDTSKVLENEEYDLWDNDIENKNKYESVDLAEDKKITVRIKKTIKSIISFIKKIYTFTSNHTPDKIIDNIDEKIEKIKKKINRIKKFWNLECTVKTRRYLKKYMVSIFKHIRPRKLKGYVHYGFDEPYKTGQVTGYLSLMPFVYHKRFSLEPDFYNKVLEGHIYMRGHIQIGYILRIVLNINLWRTIKVVRKLTNNV